MESQDGILGISQEISVVFRFFLFLLRKVIDGDDGRRKAKYYAGNPYENFCGAADRCTEHIIDCLIHYEYKVKFK